MPSGSGQRGQVELLKRSYRSIALPDGALVSVA